MLVGAWIVVRRNDCRWRGEIKPPYEDWVGRARQRNSALSTHVEDLDRFNGLSGVGGEGDVRDFDVGRRCK